MTSAALCFESHGAYSGLRRRCLKPTTSFFKCHLQVWIFLYLKRQRHETKVQLYKGTKVDGSEEDSGETETDGKNIKNKTTRRVGGFVDEMFASLVYLLQHLPGDAVSPNSDILTRGCNIQSKSHVFTVSNHSPHNN